MSQLNLAATPLECVFRWVGYPTPAPTLVFSAAPVTKRDSVSAQKTIYWNLTTTHVSNIVRQCIRLCNPLLWSKRICPLPQVPKAPGRTQSSSPPLGFLSHLSSTGEKEICHLTRGTTISRIQKTVSFPKCHNNVLKSDLNIVNLLWQRGLMDYWFN